MLETEDLPPGDLPGDPVVKISPSNAGAVGSISGWRGKILHDSWPAPPQKKKKKEEAGAGRKGHAERSMYTVKSTLENCLVRRHITDPQDSFLSELEETITDKAANFHLGATLHKPTSHICKRWNWAQHQERPALEGSQELPLAGEQQGQENSSNSFQGCRELYMLTAVITLSFLPSVYCSHGSDMCT